MHDSYLELNDVQVFRIGALEDEDYVAKAKHAKEINCQKDLKYSLVPIKPVTAGMSRNVLYFAECGTERFFQLIGTDNQPEHFTENFTHPRVTLTLRAKVPQKIRSNFTR